MTLYRMPLTNGTNEELFVHPFLASSADQEAAGLNLPILAFSSLHSQFHAAEPSCLVLDNDHLPLSPHTATIMVPPLAIPTTVHHCPSIFGSYASIYWEVFPPS